MQKLVIFGTYHDVMGLKNFRRNVIDPDYKTILEALMHVHDVDFIFEEASGFGPSVASEMATGRYLDIDSETTEQALSQFSEDTETNFLPQILDNSRLRLTARKLGLAAQKWRESCWVTKIRAQQFKSGLVICGLVHSLSIAFRLQTEGFDVEAYRYEPLKRLFDTYLWCGVHLEEALPLAKRAMPAIDHIKIIRFWAIQTAAGGTNKTRHLLAPSERVLGKKGTDP